MLIESIITIKTKIINYHLKQFMKWLLILTLKMKKTICMI